MFPLGSPLNGAPDDETTGETFRALARDANRSSVLAYAALPGIAHCQTKMVLGHDCGADVALAIGDGPEAIRRVREEFLFVGLQDDFRRSVALLHAALGVADYDLSTLTATPGHSYTSRQFRDAEAALSEFTDAFDEPLSFAARRFL